MKVSSYYINIQGVKGLCKSSGVWAQDGNVSVPLFYLHRPKWITDDKKWEEIVKSVRLDLPMGFEV